MPIDQMPLFRPKKAIYFSIVFIYKYVIFIIFSNYTSPGFYPFSLVIPSIILLTKQQNRPNQMTLYEDIDDINADNISGKNECNDMRFYHTKYTLDR